MGAPLCFFFVISGLLFRFIGVVYVKDFFCFSPEQKIFILVFIIYLWFWKEAKEMNIQAILKKAGVLLLISLMLLSSGAIGANTSSKKCRNINNESPVQTAALNRELIWDNVIGVYGSLGGIIVATVRTEGIAFPADDIKFTTEKEVTSVYWQGGYFQCQLGEGQKDYHWDWRVLFWSDDGTENRPGNEIYNQTIPDAAITREFWYNYTHPTNGNTYWVANYSADLPVPITLSANTKYWITIQGIQIPNTYPQACWSRHNITDGGILLHQAVIKAAYWGYPSWTDISVLVPDQLPHDLNFQLFGGDAPDTTPPVTTATLEGDLSGDIYISDVTVTLTATDNNSGVNYTKYKVDDGTWMTYTDHFVVSGNGDHTIAFYSVDNAGNVETEKSVTFTIRYPIEITIKGGFGVSAEIRNNGTSNLSNVDWMISLDGKLIFVGKTKSGTIASLAAGETAMIKDFVIGLGKTGIAVEADGVSANATGTVLLFFVLGVT